MLYYLYAMIKGPVIFPSVAESPRLRQGAGGGGSEQKILNIVFKRCF